MCQYRTIIYFTYRRIFCSGVNLALMFDLNLLCLNFYFRNIYLGETFSCYMSVHNDSQQTVTAVQVQVSNFV